MDGGIEVRTAIGAGAVVGGRTVAGCVTDIIGFTATAESNPSRCAFAGRLPPALRLVCPPAATVARHDRKDTPMKAIATATLLRSLLLILVLLAIGLVIWLRRAEGAPRAAVPVTTAHINPTHASQLSLSK